MCPMEETAHLEEGIGVFEEPAGDGVAGLVEGHRLLLVGLEDVALLLHAGDDALDGLFEVLERDRGVEISGGDQRRLVADVGDVGAREARRQRRHLARQVFLVQVRLQRPQVNLQRSETSPTVSLQSISSTMESRK